MGKKKRLKSEYVGIKEEPKTKRASFLTKLGGFIAEGKKRQLKNLRQQAEIERLKSQIASSKKRRSGSAGKGFYEPPPVTFGSAFGSEKKISEPIKQKKRKTRRKKRKR